MRQSFTASWDTANRISDTIVTCIGTETFGPGLVGLAFTIARMVAAPSPEQELKFAQDLLDFSGTYFVEKEKGMN